MELSRPSTVVTVGRQQPVWRSSLVEGQHQQQLSSLGYMGSAHQCIGAPRQRTRLTLGQYLFKVNYSMQLTRTILANIRLSSGSLSTACPTLRQLSRGRLGTAIAL